jgi:hypothetical protein
MEAINFDNFGGRKDFSPKIYAYRILENKQYDGWLKVGYTTRSAEVRINEQINIAMPEGLKIQDTVLVMNAIKNDGTTFIDKYVHKYMKQKGFKVDKEWVKCSVDDLMSSILEITTGKNFTSNRSQNFSLRQEQIVAIDKTVEYFKNYSFEKEKIEPKFLWNAKMRFGKTFASYKLAEKMNYEKILVVTFKPSVRSSWEEDLLSHVDFDNWDFIPIKEHTSYVQPINKKLVAFASFQDLLGKSKDGGIKEKNEWVHAINWDLVIFDEYHFGAWREIAKGLFENDEEKFIHTNQEELDSDLEKTADSKILSITSSAFLYLSGTPFRSLNNGEFIEDQIFTWSYTDEQRVKEKMKNSPGNPYESLPSMCMFTYTLPDDITNYTNQGFDQFDLNEFFRAEGTGTSAKFTHEDHVQSFLNLLVGKHMATSVNEQILGNKPIFPFTNQKLLENLNHMIWFMHSVSACHAMKNLISKKNNVFYHGYKINVVAGNSAGIGDKALPPVLESMENPLESKTITLTCGKLLTGTTVRPWTAIFMLCSLNSPETYFQAAFRVQTPWVIDGDSYDKKEIIKKTGFIFDFSINRALKLLSDYARQTGDQNKDPEERVKDFTSFLPVLAYDGSTFKQLEAGEILDFADTGTSAILLAKRWESALLVNVDDDTITRALNNEKVLATLSKIKDFRNMNVNESFNSIINSSTKVRDLKKKTDKTPEEKRELTEEQKKLKDSRKFIQDKLKKFATRIPAFMYMTDFREKSLKDIITDYEPGLFEIVTGLKVDDFNLLLEFNIFNKEVMDDAVFKFKRFEDSSLSYAGVNMHENDKEVGGFSTTLKKDDFKRLYIN